MKPAPLPEILAEVALVDVTTAAATGQMSVSWWLDEVREGRAPQPVIRANRCTRWRAIDVASFWRTRAESGNEEGNKVIQRAKAASNKATENRAARSATTNK